MKLQYGKQRRAVAPVLATLLMIAVAVAMSVIIFMWSQGFLSQTSSATGGQQGAQNQAAQSSIAIEAGTFVASSTAPSMTVIVRNVGAVAITLGSVTITGISSNTQFTKSVIVPYSPGTAATVTPSSFTVLPTGATATDVQLSKGASQTITLTGASVATGYGTASGDVVNIKVTTSVGTFAQAQFTIP